MKTKKNPGIFRLLTFALYFGDSLFSPFFSLYFASTYLSQTEKDVLIALIPFFFFAGNIFFSLFETSWKRNLWLIRIISLLEAISVLLFGIWQSFFVLLPITILAALHNSCLFGLIDGMGAASAKRHKIPFSSIRVLGGLGYIAGSLFGYFLLDKIGYTVMFAVSACFIFLLGPLSFLVAPAKEKAKPEEMTKEEKRHYSFWKNSNLWLYLIFSALFFGALNNYNYIVPIFMKEAGLSDGKTAIWTVVRVSVEVVVMFLSPLLMKVVKKQKYGLVIACAFEMLCVLFNAVIPNFELAMWLAFVARGVGYGFSLVGMVLFAQEIVGERDCPKAATLSNGVTFCFCGILNLLSSTIYLNIGFTGYFFVVFSIMAIGIAFLLLIRQKHEKTPETPVIESK